MSARTTTVKFLLLFYKPSHAQEALESTLNLQYFSPRITLVFGKGVFCVVVAAAYREEGLSCRYYLQIEMMFSVLIVLAISY